MARKIRSAGIFFSRAGLPEAALFASARISAWRARASRKETMLSGSSVRFGLRAIWEVSRNGKVSLNYSWNDFNPLLLWRLLLGRAQTSALRMR